MASQEFTNNNNSLSASSKQSRIPASLQAIFLASNRGKEVHQPPAEGTAQKVLPVHWPRLSVRRRNNHNNNNHSSTAFSEPRSLELLEAPATPRRHNKKKLAPLPAREGPLLPSLPSSSPTKRSIKSPRKSLAKSPTTTNTSFGELSPQAHLDAQLKARGITPTRIPTLQTSFHQSPTSYQKASSGARTLQLVKSDDATALALLLRAGLSQNPCNAYGESLVHMACRRGRVNLLHVFLGAGASVCICDDYGRTPLHDACWCAHAEGALQVAKVLLETTNHDPTLFYLVDKRGSLPLDYVPRDHWEAWKAFLDQHDVVESLAAALQSASATSATTHAAHARRKNNTTTRLPDPPHALPLHVASKLAAGTMTLNEAMSCAKHLSRHVDYEDYDDADETDATWDEDDSDDDFSSDSYDEDEEEDLVHLMQDLVVTMQQSNNKSS